MARFRSVKESGSRFAPGAIAAAFFVAQTVVIALFNYSLGGKIELALKERQGTVAAATAMQKLVSDMQEHRDDKEYGVLARKIAMYGVEAIRPLILMAADKGPYPEQVPISGLRLVAVQNFAETCVALATALAQRSLINKDRLAGMVTFVEKELQCNSRMPKRGFIGYF